MKIAVAGTGYVGLSMATLLAQHHSVTAVDVIAEKVDKINRRESPIQDEYIEKYFREKKLNLRATLDYEDAFKENFYGTDDAMLVERIGYKVKMVEGSYNNIKITTQEDLNIGNQILQFELYFTKIAPASGT